MEWSRVKNILIVLLATVNVFLFLVYFGTTLSDAKGDAKLVTETVNVLAKNGIEIDGKIIPRQTPILYPATGKINKEMMEKETTNGEFEIKTPGEFKSLAKRCGISHDEVKKDGDYEWAYYTFNGIPIYNCVISYDGLTFKGFAMEDLRIVQQSEPYDICGLLVAACEWLPKGEITGITQGYVKMDTVGRDVYLTPVHCMHFGERVYYVDSMSGERVNFKK